VSLLPQDHYPSVTVVAGPARRLDGITGPMLRMHDGAIYIHISPETAAQWLPILADIAGEK